MPAHRNVHLPHLIIMLCKSYSATMFFLSGLLYSLMANFVSAVPIAAAPRDVFDPLILTPTTGTVWTIGSVQNVTWSTADAPQNISNGALVVLAQGERLFEDTQGGISEYS